LPLTTLGQETRWAYSTTLPSPHRTRRTGWPYNNAVNQVASCIGRLAGGIASEHAAVAVAVAVTPAALRGTGRGAQVTLPTVHVHIRSQSALHSFHPVTPPCCGAVQQRWIVLQRTLRVAFNQCQLPTLPCTARPAAGDRHLK